MTPELKFCFSKPLQKNIIEGKTSEERGYYSLRDEAEEWNEKIKDLKINIPALIEGLTGFDFREREIKVWFFKNKEGNKKYRAISGPLLINYKENEGEMFFLLGHELFHRLLMFNEKADNFLRKTPVQYKEFIEDVGNRIGEEILKRLNIWEENKEIKGKINQINDFLKEWNPTSKPLKQFVSDNNITG